MFRNLLYKAFAVIGRSEVDRLFKASLAPELAQWQRLSEMIQANQDSLYGREHKFASIKNVSDFQAAVPINDYEALEPYIKRSASGEEKMLTVQSPFMYATTSGTTGARKLIPITKDYMREFRRASVVSGYNTLKSYPGITSGCSLSVLSPAQESLTPSGMPCGAISGRLYLEEPALIKKFISPLPYQIFLIKDYDTRYYCLLRAALVLPISFVYTLNPSTVSMLARKLVQYQDALAKDVFDGTLSPPSAVSSELKAAMSPFLKPNKELGRKLKDLACAGQMHPHKIWSNLSLICCWTKAAAAFYLKDLDQAYGGVPVCDITYGASEGRGTVLLAPDKQMLAIRSHFFEFVAEKDMQSPSRKALLSNQLEVGQNYFILFTTSSGLYRYNLNDVVKVVGFFNKTPLLEFQYKGGNVSSFTGEKLTEVQVVKAVQELSRSLNWPVNFFTVLPEFEPEPHYQLWIELADATCAHTDIQEIAGAFDRELSKANSEYATKRESLRLQAVKVYQLPLGTYDKLRMELVASGVPDAQIKVSHLNPKAEIKAILNREITGCLVGS